MHLREAAPVPMPRSSTWAPILVAALAGGCGPAPEPAPPDYRALWASGRSFTAFLAAAEAREETWRGNWARATVPAPLLARARAVASAEPGSAAEGDAQAPSGPRWRLLTVAEDWCGDSAHTVPWMARLAESVDGLEMRIVPSEAGRAVQHAHPTPDGRSATPTVVLLDAGFAERGCFVERPPELQRWFLENPDGLARDDLLEEKYVRYEADGGRSTLEEVVEVLEAAARGEVRCVGPEEPR